MKTVDLVIMALWGLSVASYLSHRVGKNYWKGWKTPPGPLLSVIFGLAGFAVAFLTRAVLDTICR